MADCLAGPGLELIVRDLQNDIPSLTRLEADGFPVVQLPYDLLMPIPKDISNESPFAACKMQFSITNGGTILTFAMSHIVADGAGTNEIFRVLSEQTRIAQQLACEDSNKPLNFNPSHLNWA
jgi:trichothecene 3-O-acetyltransferase